MQEATQNAQLERDQQTGSKPRANSQPNNPADSHIYSRESSPNAARLEAVLTSLLGAPTLVYSSGLAALHALFVHLNPKALAIGPGYHGAHAIVHLLSRLTGLRVLNLDQIGELGEGDVIHVETPVNPTGEARNLAYYVSEARKRGAYVTVDATFAPPPLQDPFSYGVDAVMHSGTKYFGGHSDMLLGTVSTRHEDWLQGLRHDRAVLGATVGSLEGWLGLRSLRTLDLRVRRQSASAEKLVRWLEEQRKGEGVVGQVVEEVKHASLQQDDWVKEQMPNGFGPVFAVVLKSEEFAKSLPSKLGLFHHATSLGGVESLIEWRAMSDDKVDRRLLRVSVGVEDAEDLKDDLLAGFEALLAK